MTKNAVAVRPTAAPAVSSESKILMMGATSIRRDLPGFGAEAPELRRPSGQPCEVQCPDEAFQKRSAGFSARPDAFGTLLSSTGAAQNARGTVFRSSWIRSERSGNAFGTQRRSIGADANRLIGAQNAVGTLLERLAIRLEASHGRSQPSVRARSLRPFSRRPAPGASSKECPSHSPPRIDPSLRTDPLSPAAGVRRRDRCCCRMAAEQAVICHLPRCSSANRSPRSAEFAR